MSIIIYGMPKDSKRIPVWPTSINAHLIFIYWLKCLKFPSQSIKQLQNHKNKLKKNLKKLFILVLLLQFTMMPNINPRQLQKAMQRMGIKQDEIEATEVIIKTKEKNLIIRNPHVTKVNMMGQESLQISGDIEEESIPEEDINIVAEQAKVSKKEAEKALKECNGDIAEAILKLK